MNYKRIEKEHFNIHLIQTDKFKTITVKVNFKRELKKEEITKRNILVNAILEGTKNNPSKRLLEIKTETLYDLGYRVSNYASGIYSILSFDMTYINPKYTEDGMNEESFKFLSELIHNLNSEDGSIAKLNFDIGKNMLEDYLVTLKENASGYATTRALEEMDEEIISYRSSGYIEDIDKIDRKELYEYYNEVIDNDIVDIFVLGDIEEDEVVELIDKNMKFENNKKEKKSHFFTHDKIDDEVKFVSEKVDKEQSTLILGFRVEDMNDYMKKYVSTVYNYILGGSCESNLFQTVREENSLCYYITSTNQPVLSISIIRSGINAKDYEQALVLIRNELENMKKGIFEESKIENAKTTYISGLTELLDSPQSIISLYSGIEYLDADDIETRKENIMKVTKEDIIEYANKIHLNIIFLLEGCDNNEEE
jgi:predicted Zn-dependent peptidase